MWRNNADKNAWQPREYDRLRHKSILACRDLHKELNDTALWCGRRLRYGAAHLCVPEEFLDMLELNYKILERITDMQEEKYLPDFAEYHRRDILDLEHFVDILRRHLTDKDHILKDLEKIELRIQKLDTVLQEFCHLVTPVENTHQLFQRLCSEGFLDKSDEEKDPPSPGEDSIPVAQPMES